MVILKWEKRNHGYSLGFNSNFSQNSRYKFYAEPSINLDENIQKKPVIVKLIYFKIFI